MGVVEEVHNDLTVASCTVLIPIYAPKSRKNIDVSDFFSNMSHFFTFAESD